VPQDYSDPASSRQQNTLGALPRTGFHILSVQNLVAESTVCNGPGLDLDGSISAAQALNAFFPECLLDCVSRTGPDLQDFEFRPQRLTRRILRPSYRTRFGLEFLSLFFARTLEAASHLV
jgi:hypothetical protein